MSALDDAELLDRYVKTRSDLAFADLYDRFAPVVYRRFHCHAIARSEIDDYVQETFLMVSQFDGREPIESVKSWLLNMVDCIALNAIREKRRQKRSCGLPTAAIIEFEEDRAGTLLVLPPDPDLAEPVDDLVAEDTLRRVRDCFARLDASERQIIEMSVFQEMNHREIAASLGLGSKTTATRRINAVLLKLREMLTHGNDDLLHVLPQVSSLVQSQLCLCA